jgi:spore germination protein YaaH
MRASLPRAPRKTPPWPVPSATPPRRLSAPPIAVRVLLVALVVLVALAGFGYWRFFRTVTDYPGSHFNQARNAVWLEHTWAGDPHSPAEYDALAARLEREQIRYVYAHVGPLDPDGTIPADRAPHAADLAAALHQRVPGIQVLAWIGQLEAASGEPEGEVIHLSDSRVRDQIARTAARFVSDDGYDGVHYDIEPITNNNPRFLDLLIATRATLPPGAFLSISAQKWAPDASLASFLFERGKASAWWTSYYFTSVAAHVDQLVVLAYNTGMPRGSLYHLVVQETTEHVLEAVRTLRHPPQVLMGMPTYDGNDAWFHSGAENMDTALNGVIAGLNSDRDTSPFAGVAVYRFATTDASEWATYERLWLGR